MDMYGIRSFLQYCLIVATVFLWAQTAKSEVPMMSGGDPVFVSCVRDNAELRDKPESSAQTLKKIPWMTAFVIMEKKQDTQGREWIRAGEIKSLKDAISLGWMLKDDLLMRQEAIKKDGIYQKAMIVVHYDDKTKEIGGAPVRHAPLESANRVGQELTLFHIYHVYDQRDDIRAVQTFYLLGFEPQITDPAKPENAIVGWVPKTKLFLWDTREAAEYDKSTMGSRKPVKIYENEKDVEDVISGKGTPEPLATESEKEKELVPEDQRFPIISKEKECNGVKAWNVGFSGDVIGGPSRESIEKASKLTRLPNALDILFVFDGTGSMKQYKDAIAQAVKEVQNATKDFWEKNYNAESKPEVQFSIVMYKDYSENDCYKREPLGKDNASKIEAFIQNHTYAGGQDQPAVFQGISQAVKDATPEMRQGSFRAVILIGDMGNMGISDQGDPKGYTTEKIIQSLKGSSCDFYAVHVASAQTETACTKFKSEANEIICKFQEGTACYLPVTDPKKVKEEIYDKIMELLGQRLALPEFTEKVVRGEVQLGKSGTILETRLINLMKQNGVNPDDFSNKGISAFATGYVLTTEPGTAIRTVKPVVLMNKKEIESLIALLGRLSEVRYEHVEKGWIEALEATTGEKIDDHKIIPADIIKKHYGLPVKSPILNMSFTDIGKLQPAQVQAACKDFEKKLFLLRCVVNEKEVSVEVDDKGNIITKLTGDKRYFFGTRNSERAWLDIDVYLP